MVKTHKKNPECGSFLLCLTLCDLAITGNHAELRLHAFSVAL